MSTAVKLSKKEEVFNLVKEFQKDSGSENLSKTLKTLLTGFISSEFASGLAGSDRGNLIYDVEVMSQFFEKLHSIYPDPWNN